MLERNTQRLKDETGAKILTARGAVAACPDRMGGVAEQIFPVLDGFARNGVFADMSDGLLADGTNLVEG